MIVFGNDQDLIDFANRLNPVGGTFIRESCFIVGLEVSDEIRAVNVFNNHTLTSIEATLLSDGRHFGNKDFIKASYIYAFHVAGKYCLNMFTEVSNDRMNRIHEKFGHHNDGIVHHWFGKDQHAIRWYFTVDDWKASKWFVEL